MRSDPLSLIGMLSTPVTGLKVFKPSRSKLQMAHLDTIHKQNFDHAFAKYQSALGGRGWLQTRQVEWLVGATATSANGFLRKLRKLGYMENRPAGGTERYVYNKGWDWRWVDGK